MESPHRALFPSHDLNGGDLLLFAGDWQGRDGDDPEDFLKWMDVQDYEYKVYVLGNHDCRTMPDEDFPNIIRLHNSTIEIGSLKIYGTPYTRTFGNWYNMAYELEMANMWRNIPEDVNMMLAHTPPYGILDDIPSVKNLGSAAMANRIKELPNLEYCVFGHIHEGRGWA